MRIAGYVCDICGARDLGAKARPEGWEQLRIPMTVHKKKSTAVVIGRRDVCKGCCLAIQRLVDSRRP